MPEFIILTVINLSEGVIGHIATDFLRLSYSHIFLIHYFIINNLSNHLKLLTSVNQRPLVLSFLMSNMLTSVLIFQLVCNGFPSISALFSSDGFQ